MGDVIGLISEWVGHDNMTHVHIGLPRGKHLRDLLRENLYFLGYKMLQQSVWVCPYNVSKETEAVLRKYSLDPYVKLFLIEEIEV